MRIKQFFLFWIFIISLFSNSCTGNSKKDPGASTNSGVVQNTPPQYGEVSDDQNEPTQKSKKSRKDDNNNNASGSSVQDNNTNQPSASSTNIPQKVYKILEYVKKTGKAPNGYVGGRNFQNRERHLDSKDASGKKIVYQEWDVNPKKQGQNRGTERLVTGSDGRSWYTNDHYQSFLLVK